MNVGVWVLAWLLIWATLPIQAQKRHNILWINVEDMSPRLSFYGDSTIATPNLDKLASESTIFDHCYSVSGVCAPSRASLITGLYPTSFGAQHLGNMQKTSALDQISDSALLSRYLSIPLYEAVPPVGIKCFTEHLRAEGYFCTNNAKTDYQFEVPITAWDQNDNNAHWKNRKPGQSFFSVFNLEITHESKIRERTKEPLQVNPSDINVPPYYPNTASMRHDLAVHYSNIKAMDDQVGQLIADLKNAGLYDSTIIFFFSDHGDGLPRAKRWLYDSGTKVPLLVRIPGQPAGRHLSLISFVDFAPTVLSLANIIPKRNLHGQGFLGRFSSPRKNRYLFAARDRHDIDFDRVRSVRNHKYKLIRNYLPEQPYLMPLPYRDQLYCMEDIYQLRKSKTLEAPFRFWVNGPRPELELYDTETDLHAINNLVQDPKYKSILIELTEQLQQWQTRIPDLSELEEYRMVKHLHIDGQQATTAKPNVSVKGVFLIVECATPGSSIAWRAVGENQAWQLYTKPVPISVNEIEVLAHKIGFKPSQTVQFTLK